MGVRVLSLIAALLLASCSLAGNATHGNRETVTIGGVFHLTGPGAVWGESERNAAFLAVEDVNNAGGINGAPLALIVEDGMTDFPATAQAIAKLLEGDATLIVGPTWFSQLASPIAEERQRVIISPSGGTVPQPSRYFFNLWPTEAQEIQPIVEHMRSVGAHRVAVIYTQNDWSASMKDYFTTLANGSGILIVHAQGITNDESDFRTLITKLKTLHLDAVYAPFAWYPQQGAFSTQARDLGLGVPLYSSSGTENPQLLATYPAIEGTLYAYPDRNEREALFAVRYEERFGHPPGPPAAYAYDAVMLAAAALRRGTDTEAIRSYLASTENYPGVSNTITFDADGRIRTKPHVMKQVERGAFVPLD